MSSKALAKFQRLSGLAKHGASKGKDTAGHVVRKGAELAIHATAALATKNIGVGGIAGIKWLRPDVIGLALAAAGWAATKGKWRRGFGSGVMGSFHAIITSWVAATEFKVINGPDGARFG